MMELPPYAAMLGLRMEGAVVRMPFAGHLVGSPGLLHGGSIAGLLEIAANMAVAAAVEEDVARKPLGVTVEYMRGGAHADVLAEAKIMRLGRRIANVRVEAWQEERDKPIAAAWVNLMLER